MKSLLLIAVFCSFNSFARLPDDLQEKTYSINANEISRYYCLKNNVFILEQCVDSLSKCINGYMFRRSQISEGMQLMNAIMFCNNSVGIEDIN